MTGWLRHGMRIALVTAGLVACAAPVLAQPAPRIEAELVLTDERIAAAARLMESARHAEAEQALARARVLQAQAREVAVRGGPPRRIGGLTIRARTQADRAIALLRGLPDSDRVQAQLERTRAGLVRARGAIERCDDDSARDLMRQAEDVQRRADAAAAENRHLAALQLTFGARERAREALRRCGIDDDVHASATRALETTDSLITHAREAPGAGGPPARGMIDRAQRLQTQARDALRAGRFPLALRLTADAGALARRAATVGSGR